MNDLREAITRAQTADAEAQEALRNPKHSIPPATALETLAGCVRDIGWRYKQIAVLIQERDDLAESVKRLEQVTA